MIRNIVFDMGNVLIDYTPELYARRFTENEADARLLQNEIFSGPEWAALDAGAIEIDEAIARIAKRLPERLRGAAKDTISRWHERIVPVDAMTTLIETLKRNGYRVYLLSNANVAYDEYKDALPFYPMLDGYVVSAFEKLVKPDAAIYRLVCERFHLKPDETVFIDDTAVNVEGAVACGWHGYCFADRDVEMLRRALGGLGVRLG